MSLDKGMVACRELLVAGGGALDEVEGCGDEEDVDTWRGLWRVWGLCRVGRGCLSP